jgi:hypothetical protein
MHQSLNGGPGLESTTLNQKWMMKACGLVIVSRWFKPLTFSFLPT